MRWFSRLFADDDEDVSTVARPAPRHVVRPAPRHDDQAASVHEQKIDESSLWKMPSDDGDDFVVAPAFRKHQSEGYKPDASTFLKREEEEVVANIPKIVLPPVSPTQTTEAIKEEPREPQPEKPVSDGITTFYDDSEIGEIHTTSDIPHHTANLTLRTREGDDESSFLPAELAKTLVVLQIEPGRVLLVASSHNALTGNNYRTVRSILRQRGLHVVKSYVAASSVFDHLLNGASDDPEADLIDSAESVSTFFRILEDGVNYKASDIHVCVRESTARVIYRIDGLLHAKSQLTTAEATAAMSVAYNSLAVPTSRSTEEPQFSSRRILYAMIEQVIAGTRWRVRYQSAPMEGGFDVVLRLLDSPTSSEQLPLGDQGYSQDQVELLNLASRKAVGAIVVSGPTSSGKTTLLNTLMTMDPDRKHTKSYTIEDPVEFRMRMVSQIQVQRDITSSDTSEALIAPMRALLRMDPDVIMAGEVRDRDMTEAFASLIMSGHRGLTTVHANNVVDLISRLAYPPLSLSRHIMGGKRFFNALVYQTLVAKLCSHCSLPAAEILDAAYLNRIATKFEVDVSGVRAANPRGCKHCYEGVRGRTVAAEILVLTQKMRKALIEGRDVDIETMWRSQRTTGFDDPNMTGKTAFEHGLWKVLIGQVDPRHLEDAFEDFRTYELFSANDDDLAAA